MKARNRNGKASALISALLLVMAASGLEAGYLSWTSHGPEGGQITALAVDPSKPDTIYAGTGFAGVFRSADGGASWSAVSTGLSDRHVHALAIHPSNSST